MQIYIGFVWQTCGESFQFWIIWSDRVVVWRMAQKVMRHKLLFFLIAGFEPTRHRVDSGVVSRIHGGTGGEI